MSVDGIRPRVDQPTTTAAVFVGGDGPAAWFGGLLTMGVVGVISAVFPDLGHIDRFEDLEGGPPEPPTGVLLDVGDSLATETG